MENNLKQLKHLLAKAKKKIAKSKDKYKTKMIYNRKIADLLISLGADPAAAGSEAAADALDTTDTMATIDDDGSAFRASSTDQEKHQ